MSVESIIIYSQSDLDICRVVLKNLNIKPYDTRALQFSFTSNCYINIKFDDNYYFISYRKISPSSRNLKYFLETYLANHEITFKDGAMVAYSLLNVFILYNFLTTEFSIMPVDPEIDLSKSSEKVFYKWTKPKPSF